jgi:hypothetical protein
MIIALLVIAAVIVSAPLAAALLGSVASAREDSAQSLGRPAPGRGMAAARRLLAFHADQSRRPAARSAPALMQDATAGPLAEASELAGAIR